MNLSEIPEITKPKILEKPQKYPKKIPNNTRKYSKITDFWVSREIFGISDILEPELKNTYVSSYSVLDSNTRTDPNRMVSKPELNQNLFGSYMNHIIETEKTETE